LRRRRQAATGRRASEQKGAGCGWATWAGLNERFISPMLFIRGPGRSLRSAHSTIGSPPPTYSDLPPMAPKPKTVQQRIDEVRAKREARGDKPRIQGKPRPKDHAGKWSALAAHSARQCSASKPGQKASRARGSQYATQRAPWSSGITRGKGPGMVKSQR
jgi:hypothetical protein